ESAFRAAVCFGPKGEKEIIWGGGVWVLNQNDHALPAISVQAPACSVARADNVSHVVRANRRKLRPLVSESDPAKWPRETNLTFRFVNACATPCVSDPQDWGLSRFHGGDRGVQPPHDPGE